MDDDLQKAINLIKLGQKRAGGQLLAEFVKHHPQNESAWLWLAYCADTDKQKIYCLNKALSINPQNEMARKELQKLQQNEEAIFQFTDSNPLKTQTNTLAIISLITSFFGWMFGILFFVVLVISDSSDSAFLFISPLAIGSWVISIITGYLGLRQIKVHSLQRGDGLSKSGIIISGIGCGMFVCLFAIMVLSVFFFFSLFSFFPK